MAAMQDASAGATPSGANPGATVSDAWSYRGFPALVLENSRLRVTVVPGHGAKILEFSSKRAGRDLLYHHPRVDLRPPVFGANADDWWTGGIDEVAPTGHASTVNGEQLPFLGEFWSQAWGHAVDDHGPERAAVHLWAEGVITPLRIDRWLELVPDSAVLHARHRLTNVGLEPVDFAWGIHPGIAVRPGSRIDVPARRGVYAEGHEADGIEPGTEFDWPILPSAAGSLDLSVARGTHPPSWELTYATQLAGGWLAVTDHDGSGFGVAFDERVFPVVWVWGVWGGWRGLYTVAVEPWTAWPARLDEVISAGRQRRLKPGETIETELRYVAYEGMATVSGIDGDGRVSGQALSGEAKG
jgi:galactose mutarotase-like enzyme